MCSSLSFTYEDLKISFILRVWMFTNSIQKQKHRKKRMLKKEWVSLLRKMYSIEFINSQLGDFFMKFFFCRIFLFNSFFLFVLTSPRGVNVRPIVILIRNEESEWWCWEALINGLKVYYQTVGVYCLSSLMLWFSVYWEQYDINEDIKLSKTNISSLECRYRACQECFVLD